MYKVTIVNRSGKFIQFDTETLPELKTVLFAETIEANKHYYYNLANGDDVEYRTADAKQASVLGIPAAAPKPPIDPGVPERRLFAPTSYHNAKLADNAPIHANSAAMVAELKRQANLGPGKMANINNLAGGFVPAIYVVKDASVPKVPITIVQNGAELTWSKNNARLKQGVRLPADLIPGVGTDGHFGVWDQVDDFYVEVWQGKLVGGAWQCSWGGFIEDVSNSDGIVHPIGTEMGGATATSLPLIGGVITRAEYLAGVIGHCIGVAIPEGPNKFVWPAQRTDSGVPFFPGPAEIPAGTRFRFPHDIVIDTTLPPIIQMMIVAIRDYGCVVQDRSGSVSFYIEDVTQYAPKPLPAGVATVKDWAIQDALAVMGGKTYGWEIMPLFPYDKLQVLA